MSRAEIDPRCDPHKRAEDVREWGWVIEDEKGRQVSLAVDAGKTIAVDGDKIVTVTSSHYAELNLSIRCFGEGERVLILLADRHPFLRWHAAGKRDCVRLDCALPRVLWRLT